VTRTSLRLAVAGLALLLVAGCGDSPTKAGAAAVVGDQRISTDELQAIVDRGLEDPEAAQQFGADRADYQRQVLNRMVRALLLEEAAEDNDVEVTQGEVDAQLADFAEQAGGREELERQAAAGGIHATDLPRFAREVVLEIALGDALTEDVDLPRSELDAVYQQSLRDYDKARTRHILVDDEAQARDILGQVEADRDSFADLAAEFSKDTSNKDDGGELGLQGRGLFVAEFDDAVFNADEGDVLLVQTQFGWHVVEVQERQTTTLAEATPELRRRALVEERTERVGEALRETAERVGVEVNPRFGRWDVDALEVAPVPDDDGLSSPAPRDGTGGQPGEVPGGVPGGGQGMDDGLEGGLEGGLEEGHSLDDGHGHGEEPDLPVESPAS
jgi:parvulin-like peptidyl-prolyl isomerase